jgi:hypothetical protein
MGCRPRSMKPTTPDIAPYVAELAAAFALRHCAWCGAPARSVVIGIPPGPDSNRCLACAGEVVPWQPAMLRSLDRPPGRNEGRGRSVGQGRPPLACQGV